MQPHTLAQRLSMTANLVIFLGILYTVYTFWASLDCCGGIACLAWPWRLAFWGLAMAYAMGVAPVYMPQPGYLAGLACILACW